MKTNVQRAAELEADLAEMDKEIENIKARHRRELWDAKLARKAVEQAARAMRGESIRVHAKTEPQKVKAVK